MMQIPHITYLLVATVGALPFGLVNLMVFYVTLKKAKAMQSNSKVFRNKFGTGHELIKLIMSIIMFTVAIMHIIQT